MFTFLVHADVLSIAVDAVTVDRKDVFQTDNFSVQLSFQDGSLCTLMYSSLGHPDAGRDRFELFFDGKTIVLRDFIYVKGYGTSKFFDERARAPQKGHEALLERFFENVQHEPLDMPVSLERFLKITELALIVDQLICRGGGKHEYSG